MRISSLAWLVLPLFLVMSGCDQGPVGPPGPPGPPGDPAVRSFIVDFVVADAEQNGTVVSAAYDAPEITPSVVRSGMVQAYFREQGTWTAMPYTYGVESPDLAAVDYTVTFGYAYEDDFFEVFYEVSNEVAIDDLVDREVKVVILYPTATASYQTLNWNDYDEVAEALGLE